MNQYLNSILNQAVCGNCLDVMSKIPENSINLIITSPPYNVGIDYDSYNDGELTMEEYFDWCLLWLKECHRTLDTDGRLALNVLYEAGVKTRGGRYCISAEFYRLALQAGFKFFGFVDLVEYPPHRVKLTSWGSWLSSSSPYIYNPKECVILFYKQEHIRKKRGVNWEPIGHETVQDLNNPNKVKIKPIYSDEQKKEFKDLVFASWNYKSEKKGLTKACFSPDIPRNAIKILSYQDDIIMDPFGGSGTTALMAETLKRNWISIDISQNYTDIANKRLNEYRLPK